MINSVSQFFKKYRMSNSVSMRQKCPNTEFLWSVFSCIRTECGVNLHIQFEYRKIRTRKNSLFGNFSHNGLQSF